MIEYGSSTGLNVSTVTVEKKTARMITRPKRLGGPERTCCVPKNARKASWESDLDLHQQSAGAHLLVGRLQLRPIIPSRAEASRLLCRLCARTRFKPHRSIHHRSLPLVPIAPHHFHRTAASTENHLQRHHRRQPSEFAILRPIFIILALPPILISPSTIEAS